MDIVAYPARPYQTTRPPDLPVPRAMRTSIHSNVAALPKETVSPDLAPLASPVPLRDYQIAALEHIHTAIARGMRDLYFSLPTGVGKSVILGALSQQYRSRGRVLVIAHLEELIGQLESTARAWCPGDVGVVMAGRDDIAAGVIVASRQSLRPARLAKILDARPEPIALLLIDECHHIASGNTYQRIIDTVRERFPGCVVVGCTATPFRADKDYLQDILPVCAFDRDIHAMTEAGWLAPLRYSRVIVPMRLAPLVFGTKRGTASSEMDYPQERLALEAMRPEVLQALVAGTETLLAKRKAVAFAVNVAHAQALAQAYQDAGIAAAAVWGEMPKDARARILAAWRSGSMQLVCNCGVLTEGFDFPDIRAIVMARPTRSLVLYTQMIGRGTRLAPDKSECLILEATPGAPEPSQITLGQVVPLPDMTLGDAASGSRETKTATLVLLDPRSDTRYNWTYHQEFTAYTCPAGERHVLFIMRDPNSGHGSGLYRVAISGYDQVDVPPGASSPLPLRQAQKLARSWLDSYAVPELARKYQAWHSQPATPGQYAFLERHAHQLLADHPFFTGKQAGEAIGRIVAGWRAPRVRETLWPDYRPVDRPSHE